MSTEPGNEPARPQPDQSAAPEPAPEPMPEITDVDEIELRDAHAAVKADGTDGKDGAQPEPATGQQPATEPAQTQPEEKAPAAAAVPTIPKPRFDEALAAQRKAEQEAAYWRGRAEATAQQQPPSAQQPAQPAAPTLDQKLGEIASQVDALAKKFDDGEITMADYKKQERVLLNQESALREEAMLAKVQPAQPAQQQDNNELYLETLTADLETKHPWIGVFEQVGTEADWGYIRQLGIDRCVAAGKDPSKGTLGRYELRKAVSEIADELGPALLTARAKAKGIALPGAQPAQQQPAAPQLSQAAKSRQAKLDLASTAPPSLANMTGASGPNAGAVSESQLEAMNDDDIGALPAAFRNKLIGVSA